MTENVAESAAVESAVVDADAGGGAAGHTAGAAPAARAGETGGEPEKPIATAEDLAAWKDGVRKSITADLRKQFKAEAEAARAKEQGDFKALYEAAEARAAELESQLRKREYEALRAKVAAKHGLPAELAARLAGEDEGELEADAKTLAKLIAPRAAPDTEAGAGARTTAPAKTGTAPGWAHQGDRPGLIFPGRKN